MQLQPFIDELKQQRLVIDQAIEAAERLQHWYPDTPAPPIPQTSGIKSKDGRPTNAPRKSVGVDPKTRSEKACNKCGKTKVLAEYPTNHVCADGHTGECKVCASVRHAAYSKARIAFRDGKYPCPHCPKVLGNAVMLEQHRRISHPKAA